MLRQTRYPKVSIIVVNWNRPQDTVECLTSIFETDYPNYEVIVVDNESSDGSVQFIRKEFPHITLIENAKNTGFTGGNNLAMQHASRGDAEYFWLLNNDAVTEPDTLRRLVEAAEREPEIGLISPVVCFYGEPGNVQFSGISLDRERYSFKPISGDAASRRGVTQKENLLVGTALLIKKRVVDDIGYLDDKYFAYVEDFEYCMRAKRCGYQSIVEPSAKVHHKDSQWRVKKTTPMVVFLRSRNTYFFWMGVIDGRGRKLDYGLSFAADRISFSAELRRKNLSEAADVCLDAVWAALRGIGGPWDKSVRMPRAFKRILSWHPYFWVGLLRRDIGGIFRTTVQRLREGERDARSGG